MNVPFGLGVWRFVFVSCAVAMIAPSTATAAWGLRYQVRLNDADPWSDSVNVHAAGTVVRFRFGAYFDPGTSITVADGTGAAAAMNRFTGQNQFTGMLAGDVITNPATRTISSGNAALTAVSGSKIGGTGITSFGSQLFLSALPDPPETYKEIYIGRITIGNGAAHVLTFKNSQFGSGNTAGLTFYTYASATNKQSAAPDASAGARTDQTATINVFPPCPSDFNGDGQVNDSDFLIFVLAYEVLLCSDPVMPVGCPCDLNADGLVEDVDFQIFGQAYDDLVCP